MKKLIICLLLICSACSAQVTFSGALLIGKAETTGGTTPTTYDPSQEFNSLSWPVGFAADSDDVATLTGTALRNQGYGPVTFVSPSGGWQMDMKIDAAGDLAYTGIALQGWSFLAVETRTAGESYFSLSKNGIAQTATMTINAAYFRVAKAGTALAFSYSTDGTTFTELEPNPADDTPAAPEIVAGTLIKITTSVGAGTATADVDYIRFTTP